jgi:fatty acid desaturase
VSTTAGDLGRREMFAEIRKLCSSNNTTNAFVLLREYAVLAAVATLCITAYYEIVARGWSIIWMSPIYLLSIMIIGVWVQNRLGCLIHESSHYLLFKNRKVNDVIANLFVAFPLFGVISNYRIGHWGHHRHVNDPEKDPDLLRLSKHYPAKFPIGKRQFLLEYVLYQLLTHKALSYLKGRAEYVAFMMRHKPVSGQDPLGKGVTWTMRISYYVAGAALLTYFGWWPHFLLLWIVPMITFYPATLYLRELGHHGNYPDSGDFTNSRVYEGYWLEREIFFPFSEQNHVLHHMFPTLPWHKMRQGHDVMMRYPPYRESVVTCDGFFFKRNPESDDPTVLDLLAAPSDRYLRGSAESRDSDAIRNDTLSDVGGSATH